MANLTDELHPGLAAPLRVIMKIMNFVLISTGSIMALTFFFVVIFRYGFNGDLFAYEEWLLALCFWMFFMASAVATHDRSHINADLLGFMLKDPKTIWIRSIAIEAIELFVCIAVTYWAFLMIEEEIAAYPNWQATIALKIPFLVPRLGIFYGFFMMAVYNLLHIYVTVKKGPTDINPRTFDETKDIVV